MIRRTYTYDLAGRLTSLTLPGASTSTTYTHDDAGARTSMLLPSGALTGYTYDGAGALSSIVTTLPSGVISAQYTRDAAGRVIADGENRYAYDDAGRLSEWYDTSADATTTYTYDAAYNLADVSVDGTSVASFTYDDADRITNAGFAYDAAGNLISDGTYDYAYDAACRLVSVSDASTEATVATYTYDAMNRRVSSTEGTATVFFHYDGASSRVIAETDAGGATIATYAYDDAGALHSMTRDGQTYYYHLNARGDVIALSDASGDIVNTYRYDPWGKPLETSESVANPYRYASYRYDDSTGLFYCWNRYYAPGIARFLTRDIYPGELTDPVTMNPYLYCGGDPVNRVDPSGMSFGEVLSTQQRIAYAMGGYLCMAGGKLISGIGGGLAAAGGLTVLAGVGLVPETAGISGLGVAGGACAVVAGGGLWVSGEIVAGTGDDMLDMALSGITKPTMVDDLRNSIDDGDVWGVISEFLPSIPPWFSGSLGVAQ